MKFLLIWLDEVSKFETCAGNALMIRLAMILLGYLK